MNEEELRRFAEDSYAAYVNVNESADTKDCYLNGYVAGATKMAEYIYNAIKFMAANNPTL